MKDILSVIVLLEMRTQRYALGSHSAAILVDMYRMAAAVFAYRNQNCSEFYCGTNPYQKQRKRAGFSIFQTFYLFEVS